MRSESIRRAVLTCWFWAAGAVQAATWVATPETLATLVPRVRAGDTLLLRPGIYRTTLDLRNRLAREGEPTVIRGDSSASGRAILRGSDVLSRWQQVSAGLYVHPIDRQPSQVFINGRVMRQIGGTVFDGYPVNPRSEYRALHPHDGGIWPGRVAPVAPKDLPIDSFWFDAEKKVVYVRTTVNLLKPEVLVEASQRERALFVENVQHLVIQDLDIEQANTSATNRGGALVVWRGADVLVKGVRAQWNDLTGIQVAGERITVQDAEASHNGQLGVSGQGDHIVVSRVRATYNNRRGFNKWWEAGGFKFIGTEEGALRDSQVMDCQALFNAGDGIWFDWKNVRVEVARNVSAYNAGFGIHYEASSEGLIRDNLIFGNQHRGVYLSSSSMTRVVHNLMLGNGGEAAIALTERGRVDGQGRPFRSDGNRVEDNVMAWNEGGMVFLSSDGGNASDRNVFLGGGSPSRFSMDVPSPANPPAYGLEAWNRRTGHDRHSWWVNAPMPAAWRSYLASRSTSLAPLRALLNTARSQPTGEGVVPGDGLGRKQPTAPTPQAGPRQVSP